MIVVWRVTQQCNLACPFCEWDRRLPRKRAYVPAETVLRFAAALADYRRETGTRVLVSWLGGEPMLWPPLVEVASALGEMGLEQSITSNGVLLGEEWMQNLLLGSFSELTLSIDGPPDFHDQIRGMPGCWEGIRKHLAVLLQRRGGRALKIRVNVVLMRDNVQAFPELCAELSAWGIDEITFNALGGRDRPEFFPDHRLHPADVDWLERQLLGLRESLAEKNVRLCGGEAYLTRLRAHAGGERLPVRDCTPGEHFVFVDEHGCASPCNFTTDGYGIDIGGIRSGADVFSLPSRFAERRRHTPHTACADCPSTQVFAKFSG